MLENKIIYDYDEAFKKNLEYFNGDELAAKVFLDKYALRNRELELIEETPNHLFERVASEIARIERSKFKRPLTYEEIYSYLDGFKKIIPQGSCLYGIGNKYQYVSLSNCYVIDSPVDSYGGIFKQDEEIGQISKRRGGVGTDLSNLRPQGSSTTNAAKTSTGVISFAERYSNTIREVGQEGRRGALMLSLSVHHPEVLRFARSKRDLQKITGANISIRLTDEFLKAVENKTTYEQRWPVDSKKPTVSRQVDAQSIWMAIVENAWAVAEPGLLFWDNILRESPADCYAEFKTTSTNPCSELPLSPLDSCRLLLLNLFGYVKKPFTRKSYFDFDEFYKDAQIAQRLMDDIVDLEIECIERIINKVKNDPEPIEIKERELNIWKKIKETCERGRRTGTGVTALGDTIAALGFKYGSNRSIELVNDIFKTLKLGCYRSSVNMAKELGYFEVWNHELEKRNPFLRRIKDEDMELWNDMKKYGRRNIACLTCAPAGSMSILTQTTSAIEPVYQQTYKRKKKVNPSDKNARVDKIDENGDAWQIFVINHPKIKLWTDVTGETDLTKSPWYGCCAHDINWVNRVKLQSTANKHIDHSISSTVNLPEETTAEEVDVIYRTAWREGCKGITIYREGTREGVMVERSNEQIIKNHAPKRPKILPAEIFHISVKKQEYFVIVGLFYGEPYEVFAGTGKEIRKSIREGLVRKVKRGVYSLCDSTDIKNVLYESISERVTEDQEAITRLASTSLRHGADVHFVVQQLEKTKGDLQSFSKAIARVLKKYIKEGESVSGEECQECGGKLIRSSGCVNCLSCGYSKCP